MGLRDHEFDVAPELLAALARGTPGPLLDQAMVHGANVAEAAAALRESEENARVHGDVNSAEAAVEAALHGVDAAIGRVRDRGLFDVGNVAGGMLGGANHLGGVGIDPQSLGPGRNTGRIAIGRYGSIRGSTTQDFITGLALNKQHRASASYILSGGAPLLPRNATETALYNSARAAEQQAEGPPNAPPTGATDTQAIEAAREYWRQKANERWAQYFNLRDPIKVDNPDAADSGSPTIDSAVAADALFRMLQSLGGLGVRDTFRESGQRATLSIVGAVDPAPESSNSRDNSSEIRHWSLWLIDPVP